jgi:predicted nucleic acid-binding protein
VTGGSALQNLLLEGYIRSERRTVKGGHRTMDVLHVAAARAHPGARFYSYDDRQRRLAQHEGLALNV